MLRLGIVGEVWWGAREDGTRRGWSRREQQELRRAVEEIETEKSNRKRQQRKRSTGPERNDL
jgi:hypothetical protein